MSIKITDTNNIPRALKSIGQVDKKSINVGVFGSGDMSMIAAVHEFGAEITVTDKMRGFFRANGVHLKKETKTIRIPERSFLRSGYDENIDSVSRKAEKLIVDLIESGVDPSLLTDSIGRELRDKIKQKLVDVKSPPLSSFTIKRKGSSNPLVDGGNLLGSIDYRVE